MVHCISVFPFIRLRESPRDKSYRSFGVRPSSRGPGVDTVEFARKDPTRHHGTPILKLRLGREQLNGRGFVDALPCRIHDIRDGDPRSTEGLNQLGFRPTGRMALRYILQLNICLGDR